MTPGSGSVEPDRLAARLLVALTALAVLAHLLGYGLPNGRFWGADGYAFQSPIWFFLATVSLLAGAAWALRDRARRPAARTRVPIASRPGLPSELGAVALAAVGALCFWILRARHLFLGDAVAIVSSVQRPQPLHPLEPLSGIVQQAFYVVAAPWFEGGGREPYQVAWLAMGLLSVAAGALFLPLLWAIARRLADPEGAATASHDSPRERSTRVALVFGVLALQGYVQLFFGYVEVYALSALAIALYLLAALRFMDGRAGLWPAAGAAGLAVCLHLSNLALVPSLAVLIAARVAGSRGRFAAWRDVALAGLAFASGWTLLGLLGGGYSLGNAALGVTRLILTAQPETFPNYFWSARHLRDFLNGQLLIGPLGLTLFVPLAIVALRSLRRWSGRTTFFVVLGVGFGAACVAAGDSNLGYARNWDLLAPAGFALTAAALALLLPRLRGRVAETGLLGLALMVSAYHTVPWIALNASLPRSFDRFATLPLELGRVESTIGYWYELRQDPAEAERWFVRALDQNPGNVRAHVFLGHLYSARGQYRLASQAFRYATDLRPTYDDYRLRLVDALVRGGQPEAAVAEVERVLRHQPDNARVWSLYGIVLLGAGRTAAAREAFEHAERAAPASWVYRTLPNYADLPDGYRRALADVWRDLIDA